MEAYAADIESKSYKLTKLDTMLSITSLQFVCFYENKESSSTFMPSDELREGFFRTLVKFPWLLGFFEQKHNGLLEIVVDKGHLNTPIYRETQSDVHFRDIKAADYNPEVWSKNLIPVGQASYRDKETKEIKLANFHVVRLRDNSGLVISANHSHAVADSASSFAFINHWAGETRALILGNEIKEVEYCFDPDILLQQLPNERISLDMTMKSVYSSKSFVCDSIMKLSPSTRGKLQSLQESKSQIIGHLFHISHSRLNALRSQVLECLPPGSRLSENDILVAVTYKVHGQAVLEAAGSKRGWISRHINRQSKVSGEHCLLFPCNLRPRLGVDDMNYIGNPLLGEFIENPMEHAQEPITAQSIAHIASQVRSAASRITPPYIARFLETVESSNTRLGCLLAGTMHYKASTFTTNIKQAGMYSADFGNGVQAFSTVPPEFGDNTFVFMSPPSSSKDTLVNIAMSPAVMDGVVKNEFWMDFATLIY